MIEIVANNNFDFDNYEYAICECTSWDEGIQVPRKEDNYFASFNCPRCGRELGLFVRQRNIKNDSIYSGVSIRGETIMEELIRKIELILIETGQHDLKFKLGEIIKYSPYEVAEILRKHKDELRQKGQWIPCTKNGLPLSEMAYRDGQKWYGYKCSNCNFIYKGNALTESPYCKKCGADMRGIEYE